VEGGGSSGGRGRGEFVSCVGVILNGETVIFESI